MLILRNSWAGQINAYDNIEALAVLIVSAVQVKKII